MARWIWAATVTLGIAILGADVAEAANPNHPYGVIPYGFAYPTDADIWRSLDFVYNHDMKKAKNWGPNGPGYYSCYNCGKQCGPYGYTGCCGLTPLHYNAIAPANFEKPYPAQPGYSFYASTPVPYQPVPGWDIPEFPPTVKPRGYSSMNGFASNAKVARRTVGPPIWYAGREVERNFWSNSPTYPGPRPGR